MVDRYGPQIEYDLQKELGLDLLDFFRGKYTWAKLDRLIGQLPQGSAYWAARVDDDEVAKAYLEAHKKLPKGDGAPPLEEMTYQNQLLMMLVDGMIGMNHRLEALLGLRPPPPKGLSRPKTAAQRLEELEEQVQMDALVAEVEDAMRRYGGEEQQP